MSPKKENELLRQIAVDLQIGAKRYANGRSTYYPGMVNDATSKLLDLGIELNPGGEGTIWAEDGMGRSYDQLDPEHLRPGHPVATGYLIHHPRGVKLIDAVRLELGLDESSGVPGLLDKIVQLKVCLAWSEGVISVGRAAELLGVDIVTAREIKNKLLEGFSDAAGKVDAGEGS